MKKTLPFLAIALFISACQTTSESDKGIQPRLADGSRPAVVSPTNTANKIALVIGNRNYEYGVLTNTLNDAQDMAQVLKNIGFDVTLKTNLNRRAMNDAIHNFGERLKQTHSIGWFYFSGHGTRAGNENYLLPTDNGGIRKQSDLQYEAIPASRVLRTMNDAKTALNIIVLDACRNQPYRSAGKSNERGLTRMQGQGSIIAFATAEGKTALDISRNKRNGLFTSHLVDALKTAYQKHQRIDDMFMQVGKAVSAESDGGQQPWYNSSLRDIYCVGGCQTVASVVETPALTPVVPPKPTPSPAPVVIVPPVHTPAPMPIQPLLPSPGTRFRDRLADGSSGPQMVWLPVGRFQMGDLQGGGDSDEKPVHWVSVQRFAIGTHEVTFAEYDRFAHATGRQKPNDRGWGRGKRPVINVSWDDATAYAKWLTQQTDRQYRLPTEAEWEYAARAGTTTKYWWGNDIGSNKANCYGNYCGDRFEYTAPVGSFSANPWGLYDTVGNVWEWTCSEFENKYTGIENKCISQKSGSPRALRGGAWNYRPRSVRTAYRLRDSHDTRYNNVGLRLARPINP